MIPNILNPFILGIITKVYDDIIDINLKVSNEIISALQSLIILFFTFTSQNDFIFSFACSVVSLLNKGFDNPFWKSLIIISIVLTIYNLPYCGNNILLKLFTALIALAGILTIAKFEDKLFPEEVSIEKIVFRILLLIIFGLLSVLLYYNILPLPSFSVGPLLKTTIILFSNMIVSVSIMTYLLYYSGRSLKELNGQ
jgi:hypothetical protein